MRNTTLVNDSTRLNLAVNQIMVDFYFAKKDFSAYDVTKTLRSKYPQEEIDHDTIKNIVHTDLRNDDRFRRVNKGGYFLYEIVPVSQSSTVQPAQVQPLQITSAGYQLTVGAERRICIPQSITKIIGGPSQEFYVDRQGVTKFVVSAKPNGGKKIHSDNHANIRLRTLFPQGQSVTCRVTKDEIVITK